MDGDLEDMNERLRQQQNAVVESFNNTLAKLLARMTNEQMKIAIYNKSEHVLNNIFNSAYNLEQYEVCQAIKDLLDDRKVKGVVKE